MNLRLGYAGITGDRAAWSEFCSGIFGLQSVHADDLLLRTDEREWRLRVTEADGPALRYLGIEADSHKDLQDLSERLQMAGHEARFDEALARERGVSALVRVADPDGNPLEFFVGAMTALMPFVSPLGIRFVTGRAGLGHVLLSVANLQRSLEFYVNLVGFSRSDILEMGDGLEGHFLNGGCRHHVVALAAVPDLVGLHHIFMEVASVADVGRAWDCVQARDVEIVSKIGQHANDPALSFYVGSPSGFAFEYGANSLTIDPANWTETRWQSPFIWGGGPVSSK